MSLTYPANALGNDANIKQVKVELPEQLPSGSTTLQKACTQAQFKANPAGLSRGLADRPRRRRSRRSCRWRWKALCISSVTVGEAFPNLIMVLQGDNVTIDLVGDTFISKSGITSSTFKAVPDQPVSSFGLDAAREAVLGARGEH